MPYSSDKQRKYFNANKWKLEKQGVDVNHWNEVSKGMNLPEKTKKAISKKLDKKKVGAKNAKSGKRK